MKAPYFALFLLLPTLASANDLIIDNNTNDNLTLAFNGTCTNILWKKMGVILPHSSSWIPEFAFSNACSNNTLDCQANVYATSDCYGSAISVVTFDISKGIKEIVSQNNKYIVSGSDYHLKISTSSSL